MTQSLIKFYMLKNGQYATMKAALQGIGMTKKDVHLIDNMDSYDLGEVVKGLIRETAKHGHPDIGGDPETFKQAMFAYSRVKKLLPYHRTRIEKQGYADAMNYASVRL